MTQTQTQTLMLQEHSFGLNLTGRLGWTPAILDMRVFTCANTDQSSNHRERFTEVWPSSFPNNFNLYLFTKAEKFDSSFSSCSFRLAPFRLLFNLNQSFVSLSHRRSTRVSYEARDPFIRLWLPSWSDWHTCPRSHASLDPISSCFIMPLRGYNHVCTWWSAKQTCSPSYKATKHIKRTFLIADCY